MGIAGRGPQIKIQAPEERPQSHARPTSGSLVASTSSVVSDLQLVAGRFIGAGNQRQSEVFIKGESEETEGPPRWLRMIVSFADAMASLLRSAMIDWWRTGAR